MSRIDMSPVAITMRLERLSQLRDLCNHLKQAGERAGLDKNIVQNESIINLSGTTEQNTSLRTE